MVQKSYGAKRGTRKKFASRGIETGITKYIRKFNVGDTVKINIDRARPTIHHRFQGKAGKIVEARGRAYVIEVRDGNEMKKICAKPEHLSL